MGYYFLTTTRPTLAVSAKPFNEFMGIFTGIEIPVIINEYDWTPFKGKTVCDIGGSFGPTMAALKAKYPDIATLSFDLPEVIDAIKDAPEGVELVKGNFFDHKTIPNCDVAFLKHIFHDWSDDDCSKILNSLHMALPVHAKLVVADAMPSCQGWGLTMQLPVLKSMLTPSWV